MDKIQQAGLALGTGIAISRFLIDSGSPMLGDSVFSLTGGVVLLLLWGGALTRGLAWASRNARSHGARLRAMTSNTIVVEVLLTIFSVLAIGSTMYGWLH